MKINNITFLNQPNSFDNPNYIPQVSVLGAALNSSYNGSGVEFGPDELRNISLRYSNSDGSSQPIKIFNPDEGYILDKITFNDFGNANNLESIENHVKKILKLGSFPLILGGDHYITLPCVSAYDEDITIIQFDAHSDYLNEKDCLNGSVMRYVANLSHVKKIIHCGLRGNLNTGPGIEESLKEGNQIITTNQIRENPKRLIDLIDKDESIYLSFDIDVLDPSIAFATGYPEPNGLDYGLSKRLLCDLAQKANVKGIDFVEYNPTLDLNGVTGTHITNLIFEFISSKFKGDN
jgi:agmatinase